MSPLVATEDPYSNMVDLDYTDRRSKQPVDIFEDWVYKRFCLMDHKILNTVKLM